MSDKKILLQAIHKATSNSWYEGVSWRKSGFNLDKDKTLTTASETLGHVNQIIFNHDFAKALRGKDIKIFDSIADSISPDSVDKNNYQLLWQYHLQQMVIAEDPIKYLGENI